jgi:polyhydroxyalkanoate synthase
MHTESSFLFFALLGTAVFVLWFLHLAFWSKRLSVQLTYAFEEEIALPDGGTIMLRRLREGVQSDEPPILLVHGIAVNHRNNDAFPDHSFARFLAEHGRDVWLLTMRSGRTSFVPVKRERKAFKAMRDHDLPHAVQVVLARTGAKQLDLSCYSMGGMVLYAALGRTLDPTLLRRVLVFASPGQVRPLGVLTWARHLPRALTPAVPMRLFMRSIAFAHAVLPEAPLGLFYNPRNVPPRYARACMMDLFEDIPGALGADFVRWSADQGRVCVDGKPILDGLASASVPVCFFAGTGDWLAPARLVRAAHDAWGRDVPDL